MPLLKIVPGQAAVCLRREESVSGQLHLVVEHGVGEPVPVPVVDAIIVLADARVVAAGVVVAGGQRQRAEVVPPTYRHYMMHFCIHYI